MTVNLSSDLPLNFILYDLCLMFSVLLSFNDGFGEYWVSWWGEGTAASWNLDRPPYFIPSPATAVNWNSRLPREFSWRYRTRCVRDTTWRKLIPWDDYVRYLGEQVSLWQRRDGGTRYSTLPQTLLKRFYEQSCSVSCCSSIQVSETLHLYNTSYNFCGSQHKTLSLGACKPAEARNLGYVLCTEGPWIESSIWIHVGMEIYPGILNNRFKGCIRCAIHQCISALGLTFTSLYRG
jgi:hypothetical protein